MISREVRRGLDFEYVLFDSWFFSRDILAHLESFSNRCIKLIALIKMGKNLYRNCLSGKELDAPMLRKRYMKKTKRNRKYNARYIREPVWYDNRRLNLFFVKLGSGSKWRAFLTSDLDLVFNKLLEIFWEIVNGIGELLKVNCMDLLGEMIRDNDKAEEIMRLFSPLFERKQAA